MKFWIVVMTLFSMTAFANDGGKKSKAMEHPKNMTDLSGQAQMQQKAQPAPSGTVTSKNTAETETVKTTEDYSNQPGKKKDKERP